jgi:hypothetical protein
MPVVCDTIDQRWVGSEATYQMYLDQRCSIQRFAVLGLLLAGGILRAGTITYDVTEISPPQNLWQYDFQISGITLQTNQEIDIEFDPNLFGALSNGVAGSDFNLLLLQTNNPPGTAGDYSALALKDNPSLAGPFSVDVVFSGRGAPGNLPFFINQLNANGDIVGTIVSGTATSAAVRVPEPGSLLLTAMAFAAMLFWRRPRRFRF